MNGISALARLAVLVRQLQGMLGGNKILRGIVAADGSLVAGVNYTPSRTGTGLYTITFDQPFGFTPAFLITGGSSGIVGRVITPAAGSVTLVTFVSSTGVATDAIFHFVAIGVVA